MADPDMNPRLKRTLTRPLAWLIAAATALGVLRALVVPPGNYNIDEAWHFQQGRLWQQTIQRLPYRALAYVGFQSKSESYPILDPRDAPPVHDIFSFDRPGDPDRYRGLAYFVLQGFVQTLLPSSVSEWVRLLAARLVTLALGGVSVFLAYHIILELFPGERLLALATAGLSALIPSFSDMTSGVNLDAPAALVGALIIYTLARILRRGASLGLLTALAIEVGLGYMLKGTVWPLYIVTVFCFWLVLPRSFRLMSVVIAGLGAIATVAIIVPVNWQGTAHWYYQHFHYQPGLVLPIQTEASSTVGPHSLQGEGVDAKSSSKILVQYLPERVVRQLRGKTITYGAWVRAATEGTTVPAPICAASDERSAKELDVTSDWQFYAATVQVLPDAEHIGCFLGLPKEEGVSVWYDGMIAVEGIFTTDAMPKYFEANGHNGVWGGRPFVNLLQNPSAEEVWPQVGPSIGYPYLLNNRIVAVLEWQRTLPAWYDLARWILVSFWSGFGGIQPGLSSLQMIPMASLTLLAALGIPLIIVKDLPRRTSPFTTAPAGRGFWLLFVAGFVVMLLLLYRADIVAYQATMLIWSSTRHASAGRAALSALLAMGLLRWAPRRWQRWAVTIGLLTLFWLNIYILLYVQYPFQHCQLPVTTDCLSTIH